MKHILNNISEEEKNKILSQYKGELKINNSKFNKLVENKLGDVKPLISEQKSEYVDTSTSTEQGISAPSKQEYSQTVSKTTVEEPKTEKPVENKKPDSKIEPLSDINKGKINIIEIRPDTKEEFKLMVDLKTKQKNLYGCFFFGNFRNSQKENKFIFNCSQDNTKFKNKLKLVISGTQSLVTSSTQYVEYMISDKAVQNLTDECGCNEYAMNKNNSNTTQTA